ncbi:MAG: helix-turn-helix transcriptional regulator [Cellulophaga sp.]
METNFNIISVITVIGLIQGLILGFLILIINRKRLKTILFLGLFIITYALGLIPELVESLNLGEKYPRLQFLPLEFLWLYFSLFYIYVQKISIFSKRKPSYWTLIPGILYFIFTVYIYFQDRTIQLQIDNSLWKALLDLGAVFYSFYICIKIIQWIKKHDEEIKNQYTSQVQNNLRWVKQYTLISLALHVIPFLMLPFYGNVYVELIVPMVDMVMLYWLSLRGILQRNIVNLVVEECDRTKINIVKGKKLSQDNVEETFKNIESFIVGENAFIKPNLTIVDVAEKVGRHPKYVSGIINSTCNQNFNSYVNKFRIEKAKGLLKNVSANNLSIEGIANEVGFQSKSSFYEAFKKQTGTTPLQYKNGR